MKKALNLLESEIQKHINQTESIPGYIIVSPTDYKELTGLSNITENPTILTTKYGKMYLESKKGTERPIII